MGSWRTSRFVRVAATILRPIEVKMSVWGRLAITSFVVALAVYAAHSIHLLEGPETRWRDVMAQVDRPELRASIAVVAITDADYHDPSLFGGTSPLNPSVVARVVERVLHHAPRGVVLDIQIHPAAGESPERVRGRLRLYHLLDSLSVSDGPPIVLVRDLEAERLEGATSDSIRAEWRQLTENPRLSWADPDIELHAGCVRALPPTYPDQAAHQETRPTILGASIEAFDLTPQRSIPPWAAKEDDPTAPWGIRFTGTFLEDTTAAGMYHTSVGVLLSGPRVAGQYSLLTNRIVLVGGTYYAGRDHHPTVLGHMAGVHIWAEAIASWIRHDALREPIGSIAFALEFLIGLLAGLLLVRLGPAIGLLLGIAAIFPLAVISSIVTFGEGFLFVNFLPSFVAVYGHYQIEIHYLLHKQRHQIQDLREELAGG